MASPPRRSIVIWVIVASLLYSGIYSAQLLGRSVLTGAFQQLDTVFVAVFAGILIAFSVLFLAFAYGSWRQRRWGYLGGALTAIVSVLLNLGDPTFGATLVNTANPSFPLLFTSLAAAVLAVAYGVYEFRLSKKSGAVPRQISRVSIPAFIVIGVVVGGLIVGALAAGTQLQLLSTAGAVRDVTVVVGADNPANGRFYDPETLTVSSGRTVVWFNGDAQAHTVTSKTGVFDSKNMNSGTTFQFTFSQSGSYEYFCTYHTWMTGKVTVSS